MLSFLEVNKATSILTIFCSPIAKNKPKCADFTQTVNEIFKNVAQIIAIRQIDFFMMFVLNFLNNPISSSNLISGKKVPAIV